MIKNIVTLGPIATILLILNITTFRNNLILTMICSISIVIIAGKLLSQVFLYRNKYLK